MASRDSHEPAPSPWRALASWRALWGIWLPLALITTLHYATPSSLEWVHGLARRLYYLPIVLAAFAGGLRGGLAVALAASLVYLPHAFTHLHHMDPGSATEKLLEMVLYLVVGLLAGLLVDRERAERRRQEALARRLQRTLDELRNAELQLMRSARLSALGQLTAGLAHEIKNPLHAMRGTAEIIGDALQDEAARRMQRLLLQEVDRLSALLERFLGFARQAPLELTEFDLRQVAERVEGLMGAQARQADVELVLELPDEALVTRGDPEQLTQLCLGIALNGLQALAAREASRQLTLGLARDRRDDQSLHVILLRNNGPAIPAEMMDCIFDPFVTSRDDGTGLGLSIAARIAYAHGGFIEARNLAQEGVEFAVYLPAHQAVEQ